MNKPLWTQICLLETTTPIADFSCGEPEIDIWIQRDALEQQEQGSCKVYVALNEHNQVIGFFSLSMYSLQKRVTPPIDSAPSTSNIPCILLGKFGIHHEFQKQQQGALLIKIAKQYAHTISQQVGCRLMYVQTLRPELIPWYRKQGFTSLPKTEKNLVYDLHKLNTTTNN